MKTLFKLFAAMAVLVALAVASPIAQAAEPRQYSVVVKIDGAPGDSQALKDGIDVLTYHWSLAAVGNGHGRAGGRVELAPFVFVHAYDKASPALFNIAAQGKFIKQVDFYIFKTGGNPAGADQHIHVTLKNVLISGITVAGHGELPTQQVTLHYSSIQWEHSKSGAKGNFDNR